LCAIIYNLLILYKLQKLSLVKHQ